MQMGVRIGGMRSGKRGSGARCAYRRPGGWLAIGLSILIWASPSLTEEEGHTPAQPGAGESISVSRPEEKPALEPPPSPEGGEVELDRLLKLPSTMTFGTEKRNGATAEEWRARFEESRTEIAEAKRFLRETRNEIDSLAGGGSGGQWQVAPPGSNNTENTPMSFKLREDVRKGKERLHNAERKHRELEIQADLAGVPESWRHGK